MGMGKMFTDGADFSDLLDSPEPLKVSKVIHKAFIEVNEEGAEAAAATGKFFFYIFVFISTLHGLCGFFLFVFIALLGYYNS